MPVPYTDQHKDLAITGIEQHLTSAKIVQDYRLNLTLKKPSSFLSVGYSFVFLLKRKA